MEERQKAVEHFWQTGELNPECNVQFGEGGAGTFSDGKLNTLVKDPAGRIRLVLETFVKHGANPDILYSYKPHVGTDVLALTVKNIREEIIALGGRVLFETKLTDLTLLENGSWKLTVQETSGGSEGQKRRFHMEARAVVLAIGHSARDTFQMLYEKGIAMEAKSFAVGLRIEHPQRLINDAMYGKACPYSMPPAPYKVTHKLADGRGVYSFCMCPGGYVVNASSEPGRLAVNGMSYRSRDGENANSAIVVTVSRRITAAAIPSQRGVPAPSGGKSLSGGRRQNPDSEICGLLPGNPQHRTGHSAPPDEGRIPVCQCALHPSGNHCGGYSGGDLGLRKANPGV